MRLHLGCGPHRLDGWVNIDRDPGEGVDRVLDVTRGLPFENVELIFGEHFVEHLEYVDALQLFADCRRVLRDDGVLRLTTPNLDWVWASHYRAVLTPDQELLGCFALNRAFRAWGHRFLWNLGTLRASLLDAGFGSVERRDYGESPHPALRGLERHEQNPDFEGRSHILVVEAWGRGGKPPEALHAPRSEYLRDMGVK